MQATRPLLSIALLLSFVLSGPAIAEYPFPPDAGDTPAPTTAPLPSRKLSRPKPDPQPRGSRPLARGRHRRPTEPRNIPGLFEGTLSGRPLLPIRRNAGDYNIVSDASGDHTTAAYSAPSPRSGAYNTVAYDDPLIGGPPAGNLYGGDPHSGPYPGAPYSDSSFGGDSLVGPYGGGGYDVVPYDDFSAEAFGPDGGPMFDEPYPYEDLFAFDAAIWPGFISGNLTPGTERFLYGGELFVPLYQDGRTMWYFNFRGQGDDNSASEFNTGTGVRVLTDPGWIFGAYTYWDHLKSRHGNHFNQGMIGVEAMSVLWDARMNVYFPESGGESAGPAIATVSNGNLVVSSGVERAYWGMDFELGHLLWAYGPNAQHEMRGFAAIYHFDHSAAGYGSITGPRVRGEYRWHDLPYFGPGSRFTFGLTLQGDDERDAQLFAFARLRIPLDAWAHSRRPLSPLHRRMLDNVVRDVDVVTNTTRHSERAVNPMTGREIRGYARIDANTSNAADVLSDLDTDALIVLDGSKGVIHAPTGHMLKTGQTVIGGDTRLDVVGARTNRRATFDPRGERPTLDFKKQGTHSVSESVGGIASYTAYSSVTGLRMNDNTQLIGVDMQNVGVGVGIAGAENVLVRDVEISDFSVAGIDVSHSSNVRLDNVRVRDAWPDSGFYPAAVGFYPRGTGIRIVGSKNVEVTDSLVDDTQREGILVANSQNVAIRRTKIRDTKREGIRVVKSKNVRIEDVELKNTGKRHFNPQTSLSSVFGGIALDETEDTTIADTRIHGSDGDGILFRNSRHLTLTDSTILLSGPPAGGGQTQQDQATLSNAGAVLFDPAGDIVLTGNSVTAPVNAFWMSASGGSGGDATTSTLQISDNQWDGTFDAGITEGARVKMAVTGNHFGGDPMGQLSVEQNGWLELQYTGNTSNAGAGMLQILNDGGDLSATFDGNDHTPMPAAP